MKTIILFFIAISICFGQIQQKHLSVIARKNIVTGVDTIPTFTFTDATDVALSSNNTGFAVVGNCDSARFYPASGDTLKDGLQGTYGVAPIWIQNADTVYTPLVASGTNSTATHSVIYAGNSSTVDTFSVTTVAGSETGELFSDDFEDGNVSDDWTTLLVDADNTLTIESGTVNSGTYSAKYTWDGLVNDNWLQKDFESSTQVYFRGYLYVDSLFRGATYGLSHSALLFYDNTTLIARLFIIRGNTDENPDDSFLNWRLWLVDDGDNNAVEQAGYTHNTWLRVEVGWEQGTGADGSGYLYIDGVEIIGDTGFDYTTYEVDRIRLGTYSNYPVASSFLIWDDIVVDSTDYPGAKP